MLHTALTGVVGAFYTLIGCVKVGRGSVVAPMHEMQLAAVSSRYQPALAELLPPPVGPWLKGLATEDLLVYIGAPELAFGLILLLSLSGMVPASVDTTLSKAMMIFMIGPIAAHFLGDDFSLPMDSNVGPTGFIPAALFTTLIAARLSLAPAAAGILKPGGKYE